MIGQTVSHYRILGLIGRGGMGEVFLAEDTSLHRKVALKFLSPEIQQDPSGHGRILREARSAAGLEHANICTIHEVGSEKGKDYIVMEYVDGQTLRDRLAQGPVPIAAALRIIADIADALEEAHEKGIIHSDLKPANVMLTQKGRAKVMDFGLAMRWLPKEGMESEAITLSAISSSRIPGGTLAYMSPEQLLGKRLGPQSDIFSLGVVFYELLTGEHPFRAATPVATSDRILHEEPIPVVKLNPGVPEKLGKLVKGMLSKAPGRRPSGIRELLKELDSIVPAASELHPAQARLWAVFRHTLAKIFAVIGALVLLLMIGFFLLQSFYGSKPEQRMPSKIHIAVLPFDTTDSEEDVSFYAKELTEAVNNSLTKITERHPLQVVPADEVHDNNVHTPKEAHREFGVNLVLRGNLQKGGESLRITYEIINPKTNQSLQSKTVTAAIDSPFDREDIIITSVLESLGIELEPEEKIALANRGTHRPSAYDYYMSAGVYLQDFQRLESVRNAINVLSSALEQDPEFARAYAKLGEAYWHQYQLTKETARIEEALSSCDEAVLRDEGCASGHACLGVIYTGTGKYEEAVSEFERAVSLEPTNNNAFRGLGSAYEYLGKILEAEHTYRRAIELLPQYWAGYNDLGRFYSQQGRYKEAAEQFRQVIKLTPDNFVGYSNLGGISMFEGDYEEAIQLLKRSVDLRPTSIAYSNLGTAYFFQRRFQAAIDAYEEATELDNQEWEVWGNLGDAYYWASGTRPQADSAYRKALQLGQERLRVNPRDSSLLGYMAYYYAMLDERENAQSFALKAISSGSGDPELFYSLALVFCKLGEKSQSITWLEKAIESGFSRATVQNTPLLAHALWEYPEFQSLLKEN
jgi:serine/threonine protein kinase/tetratricopeptide (TPR) repeat protein